jgi:hypothetical protein
MSDSLAVRGRLAGDRAGDPLVGAARVGQDGGEWEGQRLTLTVPPPSVLR